MCGDVLTRCATTGHGYFELQSTKPQTLGYALADSPVALLAWVYEKLVTWTDEYDWQDDEGSYFSVYFRQIPQLIIMYPVLTWVSLYLFSRSGPAASVRIYYEVINSGQFENISKLWSDVPLGLSYFPSELYVIPKTYVATLRTCYNAF